MSGILNEIEVSSANELEIAAAVVFLKARARHFGKDGIPLAVKLSPLAPETGWRRAAVEWIETNKESRQRGELPRLSAPPQPQGQGFIQSIQEALQ